MLITAHFLTYPSSTNDFARLHRAREAAHYLQEGRYDDNLLVMQYILPCLVGPQWIHISTHWIISGTSWAASWPASIQSVIIGTISEQRMTMVPHNGIQLLLYARSRGGGYPADIRVSGGHTRFLAIASQNAYPGIVSNQTCCSIRRYYPQLLPIYGGTSLSLL